MKRLTVAERELLRALAGALAVHPLDTRAEVAAPSVRLLLTVEQAQAAARVLLNKIVPPDADEARRVAVNTHVALTRFFAERHGVSKREAARLATKIELPPDPAAFALGIEGKAQRVSKQNRQRVDYIARQASRKSKPK
jgi:hypothetical protein